MESAEGRNKIRNNKYKIPSGTAGVVRLHRCWAVHPLLGRPKLFCHLYCVPSLICQCVSRLSSINAVFTCPHYTVRSEHALQNSVFTFQLVCQFTFLKSNSYTNFGGERNREVNNRISTQKDKRMKEKWDEKCLKEEHGRR